MNKDAIKAPERMTQDMLDVIDNLPDMKEEFFLCLTMRDQADKALKTDFPATSVTGGEVIHLSRLKMRTIRDYWTERYYAVRTLIPSETYYEWDREYYGD